MIKYNDISEFLDEPRPIKEVRMVERQISVQETLEWLLEQHDMTEAELARKAGMPQPTLHRLLSGATPDPRVSTLIPIAKLFNIPLGQLVGQEPLVLKANSEPTHKKILTKIPLIPWDQAIAWHKLVGDYTPRNWDYWVTTSLEISSNSYALTIESKSLPELFSYGSVLIVDPNHEPQDSSYVIAYRRSDKSTTIKRLSFEGNNRWLVPLNEKINAIIYDEDTEICGTIIQVNVPLVP